MASERISIKDTAEILGMSESCVRVRMERNLFQPPIGRCMPSLNGKTTRYLVFRDMLERFISGE